MRPVLLASLRAVVKVIPDVLPFLSDDTRYSLTEIKSYEQFDSQVEGLVFDAYYYNMGFMFVFELQNIVTSQLTNAYQKAWADSGFFSPLPDFLSGPLQTMVTEQYKRIDGFYNDIVKARNAGTPIAPLIARGKLWANQFKNAYNEAIRLIALYAVDEMIEGEDEDSIILAGVVIAGTATRLIWHYGDTEHCTTCQKLNGIVAFAVEWAAAGVHPQGAPNGKLECGGWRCGCSLSPTMSRRSKGAMQRIQDAIS